MTKIHKFTTAGPKHSIQMTRIMLAEETSETSVQDLESQEQRYYQPVSKNSQSIPKMFNPWRDTACKIQQAAWCLNICGSLVYMQLQMRKYYE